MNDDYEYICYGCDMGCCSECDSSGCECRKARHRLFYVDRGVWKRRTPEELLLMALAEAADEK